MKYFTFVLLLLLVSGCDIEDQPTTELLPCPKGTVGYRMSIGLETNGNLTVPDSETFCYSPRGSTNKTCTKIPEKLRGVTLAKKDVTEKWMQDMRTHFYNEMLEVMCKNPPPGTVGVKRKPE